MNVPVNYPASFTRTHIFPQIALFPLVYRAVTSKTISLLLHLLSVMSGYLNMLVLMDAKPGAVNQMIKAIKTNIYRSTLERYGAAFNNTFKAPMLAFTPVVSRKKVFSQQFLYEEVLRS